MLDNKKSSSGGGREEKICAARELVKSVTGIYQGKNFRKFLKEKSRSEIEKCVEAFDLIWVIDSLSKVEMQCFRTLKKKIGMK